MIFVFFIIYVRGTNRHGMSFLFLKKTESNYPNNSRKLNHTVCGIRRTEPNHFVVYELNQTKPKFTF